MVRLVLTILFGAFMILAGVMHFITPGVYTAFIPNFLPARPVIYGSGVIEILLGLATLLPRSRRSSAIGIFVLMIVYLPLHLVDLFRQHPAVGSHAAALIRFLFQFVLIYWAWYIAQKPQLAQYNE